MSSCAANDPVQWVHYQELLDLLRSRTPPAMGLSDPSDFHPEFNVPELTSREFVYRYVVDEEADPDYACGSLDGYVHGVVGTPLTQAEEQIRDAGNLYFITGNPGSGTPAARNCFCCLAFGVAATDTSAQFKFVADIPELLSSSCHTHIDPDILCDPDPEQPDVLINSAPIRRFQALSDRVGSGDARVEPYPDESGATIEYHPDFIEVIQPRCWGETEDEQDLDFPGAYTRYYFAWVADKASYQLTTVDIVLKGYFTFPIRAAHFASLRDRLKELVESQSRGYSVQMYENGTDTPIADTQATWDDFLWSVIERPEYPGYDQPGCITTQGWQPEIHITCAPAIEPDSCGNCSVPVYCTSLQHLTRLIEVLEEVDFNESGPWRIEGCTFAEDITTPCEGVWYMLLDFLVEDDGTLVSLEEYFGLDTEEPRLGNEVLAACESPVECDAQDVSIYWMEKLLFKSVTVTETRESFEYAFTLGKEDGCDLSVECDDSEDPGGLTFVLTACGTPWVWERFFECGVIIDGLVNPLWASALCTEGTPPYTYTEPYITDACGDFYTEECVDVYGENMIVNRGKHQCGFFDHVCENEVGEVDGGFVTCGTPSTVDNRYLWRASFVSTGDPAWAPRNPENNVPAVGSFVSGNTLTLAESDLVACTADRDRAYIVSELWENSRTRPTFQPCSEGNISLTESLSFERKILRDYDSISIDTVRNTADTDLLPQIEIYDSDSELTETLGPETTVDKLECHGQSENVWPALIQETKSWPSVPRHLVSDRNTTTAVAGLSAWRVGLEGEWATAKVVLETREHRMEGASYTGIYNITKPDNELIIDADTLLASQSWTYSLGPSGLVSTTDNMSLESVMEGLSVLKKEVHEFYIELFNTDSEYTPVVEVLLRLNDGSTTTQTLTVMSLGDGVYETETIVLEAGTDSGSDPVELLGIETNAPGGPGSCDGGFLLRSRSACGVVGFSDSPGSFVATVRRRARRIGVCSEFGTYYMADIELTGLCDPGSALQLTTAVDTFSDGDPTLFPEAMYPDTDPKTLDEIAEETSGVLLYPQGGISRTRPTYLGTLDSTQVLNLSLTYDESVGRSYSDFQLTTIYGQNAGVFVRSVEGNNA